MKLQGDLNKQVNFQTFGRAFLTLIRVSTGESWNYIMYDIIRKSSPVNFCIKDATYQDFLRYGEPIGCGGYITAKIYFLTFYLIFSLIFLNLFIAIILKGFDDTNQQENTHINEQVIDDFRAKWTKFDPDGKCFIKISDFSKLLFELGTPLGWDESFRNDHVKRHNFIQEINIPTYNDWEDYGYFDVLNFLSKMALVVQHKDRILKDANQDVDDEDVHSRVVERVKDELQNELHQNSDFARLHKIEKQVAKDIEKNKDDLETDLELATLKIEALRKKLSSHHEQDQFSYGSRSVSPAQPENKNKARKAKSKFYRKKDNPK